MRSSQALPQRGSGFLQAPEEAGGVEMRAVEHTHSMPLLQDVSSKMWRLKPGVHGVGLSLGTVGG